MQQKFCLQTANKQTDLGLLNRCPPASITVPAMHYSSVRVGIPDTGGVGLLVAPKLSDYVIGDYITASRSLLKQLAPSMHINVTVLYYLKQVPLTISYYLPSEASKQPVAFFKKDPTERLLLSIEWSKKRTWTVLYIL